jgi:hypothetical protein
MGRAGLALSKAAATKIASMAEKAAAMVELTLGAGKRVSR